MSTEINDEYDFKMAEDSSYDNLYSQVSELFIEEQDLRLLKGILSSNKNAREFITFYTEDLFIGSCKEFAKHIISYIKSFKEAPTRRVLIDYIEHTATNSIDLINEIWDRIDSTEYNILEFNYDLQKIKERFAKARIVNLKENLNKNIEDNVDWDKTTRIIQKELNVLNSVSNVQKQVFKQQTLKEALPQFRENFVRKLTDKNYGRGIQTGYSYLDYITGGLRGSELLLIGGESGAGKSMFLLNMAIQMWMQKNTIYTDPDNYMPGYDVLYFSLEMPHEACMNRILARLADLATYSIRDARVSKDKIKNLDQAAKFILKFPNNFEIVDIPRGASIEQIEERYLESIENGRNPKIVAIDYLGLMDDPGSQQDDWLKLGNIAGKVHEFTRVYDLTGLSAVQLNRPPNKHNADPSELIGMHRIGRSSNIIFHANIGVQIESRKDEHTYSDLIYHVIKNREGELGSHILMKNFQNASLKDMDEPYCPQLPNDNQSILTDQADISGLLEKLGWGED